MINTLTVRQEQAAVLSALRSSAGAKTSVTSIAENINLDRFPGLSVVTPQDVTCTVEALRLRSALRTSLVVSQSYVSLAEHRQRVEQYTLQRSLSYCVLASTTLLAACGTTHLSQSQLPNYYGGTGVAHRAAIYAPHNSAPAPLAPPTFVAQVTQKTLPAQPLTLASASYFNSYSKAWEPDATSGTALANATPQKAASNPIQRAALETLLAVNDKAFLDGDKAQRAESDLLEPSAVAQASAPQTVSAKRIALAFEETAQDIAESQLSEKFIKLTPVASTAPSSYLDILPGLDSTVPETVDRINFASSQPSVPSYHADTPAEPSAVTAFASASSAVQPTSSEATETTVVAKAERAQLKSKRLPIGLAKAPIPAADASVVASAAKTDLKPKSVQASPSKTQPTSAYDIAKAKDDPAWRFVYRATNFQRAEADLWVETSQPPAITLPRLTLNFPQEASEDYQVSSADTKAAQANAERTAIKLDDSHYLVSFKNNSQRLTADIEQQALSIIRTLGTNEKVVLRGRVGKSSLTEEDAKLAVARAMQVRKQLVAHGMPKENIRIVLPRTKDLIDASSFDSPLNMSVSVYRMPPDTRTAFKQERSPAS